jgi:hypothetical protein
MLTQLIPLINNMPHLKEYDVIDTSDCKWWHDNDCLQIQQPDGTWEHEHAVVLSKGDRYTITESRLLKRLRVMDNGSHDRYITVT